MDEVNASCDNLDFTGRRYLMGQQRGFALTIPIEPRVELSLVDAAALMTHLSTAKDLGLEGLKADRQGGTTTFQADSGEIWPRMKNPCAEWRASTGARAVILRAKGEFIFPPAIRSATHGGTSLAGVYWTLSAEEGASIAIETVQIAANALKVAVKADLVEIWDRDL